MKDRIMKNIDTPIKTKARMDLREKVDEPKEKQAITNTVNPKCSPFLKKGNQM